LPAGRPRAWPLDRFNHARTLKTTERVVEGCDLGFLTGFLLYIGASDILPRAHSKRSSWANIALTVGGAALVYLMTKWI